MPPAIRILVSLLAISGGILPASADDPSKTAGTSVEYSVLTPGLEGKIFVCTDFDLSFVGLTGLIDRKRSKTLREIIEREGFEPGRHIAEAVLLALKDAGRTGTYEPIARRPPGRIQSLTVDELPQRPQGAVMLDITITWIGLRAAASTDVLRPGFSLVWRLISRDGKLLAPGRELRYVHAPLHRKPVAIDPSVKPHASPAAEAAPPEESAQEFCTIRNLDAAQNDPAALWQCFDEAFLAAGRKLVSQLPPMPMTADGG
ncbi:MAG: hypothetical protein OEW16_00905 [Gammaproteobacteria bacterium]|nr:hypothetical protein [Gammaproteobacteria bacterium]